VGKDIFGGVAKQNGASNASVVTFSGSDSANLLETVGNLIGYLETNNEDGIGECVDDLTSSLEHIENALTKVGGKENRVSSAKTVVETLSDNATTTLSSGRGTRTSPPSSPSSPSRSWPTRPCSSPRAW